MRFLGVDCSRKASAAEQHSTFIFCSCNLADWKEFKWAVSERRRGCCLLGLLSRMNMAMERIRNRREVAYRGCSELGAYPPLLLWLYIHLAEWDRR